ncbi:MAG: TlpA family protein disulfide reductase [Candidatus Marithrix sp.]|nr:TlpA family protein disulfide reductase [Candidatus Marithrix sp.]
MKPAHFVLFVGLIMTSVASVAGYLWFNPPQRLEKQVIYRPDFSLTDIDGKVRNVSEWDNKILVVNFWATWCPPCVREMPLFVEIQHDYAEIGLQVIGIAVDKHEAILKFLEENNINYPILEGDDVIEISKKFGNRLGALPFTAVVDRNGNIVERHVGDMNLREVKEKILSLL